MTPLIVSIVAFAIAVLMAVEDVDGAPVPAAIGLCYLAAYIGDVWVFFEVWLGGTAFIGLGLLAWGIAMEHPDDELEH